MKRCLLIIGFLLTNLIHGQMIINSYAYPIVSLGTELYPQDNAISYTEVDFLSITTGATPIGSWGSNGTTTAVSIAGVGKADTEVAYSVSWCMKYLANGSYVSAGRGFSSTIGNLYKVSFYAKLGLGTTGSTRSWTGVVTSPTQVFTTSWTYYEFTVEANATTIGVKFSPSWGGAVGNTIYVDYFSILEL